MLLWRGAINDKEAGRLCQIKPSGQGTVYLVIEVSARMHMDW